MDGWVCVHCMEEGGSSLVKIYILLTLSTTHLPGGSGGGAFVPIWIVVGVANYKAALKRRMAGVVFISSY